MSVAIWGLIFLQIGYILNQAYQHGLIDGNKKFIFGGWVSKVQIKFTWTLKMAKDKAFDRTMSMMYKEVKKSRRIYKDDTITCEVADKGMSYIFTISGKNESIKKIYAKQIKASKKKLNKAVLKTVGKIDIKMVKL